jgi:hypothetical protein
VIAAVVTTASAQAHDARRFDVLAYIPAGHAYAADVWGYSGHAYLSSHKGAITCPAQGVRVFDLADPRHPKHVATFADGESEPVLAGTFTEKTIVRRVVTRSYRGDVAVTSLQRCENDPGFRGFGLYDVTDPAHPKRLALVRTEPAGSHEIWLAAARGHAWVYTAITRSEPLTGKPGFRIFDVTNPRRPRQVGRWGALESLGIGPGEGRRVGSLPFNISHSVITNAAATRAFLSYWDLGTVILDISNPARPRYLGRTRFRAGESGDAHSAWLFSHERLLIETHEGTRGIPFFYDVSNPRAPRRLSEFALPQDVLDGAAGRELTPSRGVDYTDSVHDAKVQGSIAYFSWYNQGVVAADVSDPRHPRFLARFLPPPVPDPEQLFCAGRSCNAFWGVFPLGDLVLASDIPGGLWVLRLP